MNIYTNKFSAQQVDKIRQFFESINSKFSPLQYGYWKAEGNGYVASFYKSLKFVVQGKMTDKIASDFEKFMGISALVEEQKLFDTTDYENNDVNFSRYIGTDESGKGDFFGPLVIAGVYVDEELSKKFVDLGIKDSKKLDDKMIVKMSAHIRNNAPHSVVVVMPEKYNELVLVVDADGQIPLSIIYALNLIKDFNINDYLNKKDKPDLSISYENIVNEKYKLLITPDYYEKVSGVWENKSNDKEYLNRIIQNKEDISIVGILKIKNSAINDSSGYIGYTKALANYIVSKTLEEDIVKEQLQNKDINILTNQKFDDNFNYDDICTLLGISDINNPTKINIYPKNFEAKEKIEGILNKYNEEAIEDDKIMYTDFVKILMNGINTIINVITYILVAFVAISLIVSSIMIAIITYISVLERTKEIGILRAIGASKKDISRIFNAETIIEGAFAGSLGILLTLLLNKVVDKIVYNLSSVANITHLSFCACIILVLMSIFLSFIAGLIPSKIASKKDPVISLRSE